MHTGFYFNKNFSCNSFEWLRNIKASGKFSAYDFLHGFCTTFAKILNEEIGLPVEFIWSEDKMLVHSYCVKKESGKVFFFDVRGVTDDETEFFKEFSECFCNLDYPQKCITSCEKYLLPENDDALKAAKCLFEKHKKYYEINRKE